MNRRVLLLAALPLTFAGASTASGETPDALTDAARARRTRAEAALADHRRQRLDALARLARDLQEANAKLADARRSAERAETALDNAKRARDETAPLRARAARRADALARLLGQAGNLAPDARPEDPAALLAEVDVQVQSRLQALDHDTHIHRDAGLVLGRTGEGGPAEIVRVGRLAALAFDSTDDHTGFLREEPQGPPLVVGPKLSEAASTALRNARPGQTGYLPFDLDGALVRVQAEPPTTDRGGLKAAGVFVWPILAVGLLGAVLFLERLFYFVVRPASPGRVRRVVDALARGDVHAAKATVSPPRTDLDRVLSAGITTHGAARLAREQALETALLREEPALERGVGLLGAIAGLAPLLGLLGTVTGMITTFDVISTFGTGNPRLLSAGISLALITTQLGLIVAVPTLLAHAWVSRAAAKRQALLEEARTALLSLEGTDDAA